MKNFLRGLLVLLTLLFVAGSFVGAFLQGFGTGTTGARPADDLFLQPALLSLYVVYSTVAVWQQRPWYVLLKRALLAHALLLFCLGLHLGRARTKNSETLMLIALYFSPWLFAWLWRLATLGRRSKPASD